MDDSSNPDPIPVSQSREKQKAWGTPSPLLMTLLIIPILGIGFALFSALRQEAAFYAVPTQTIRNIEFPAVGFTLPDLNGNPLRLDDFEGGILFLTFWQTDCGSCAEQLRALGEFASSSNIAISIVAINFDETSEQIRSFLMENDLRDLPYSIVLDPISRIRKAYGVEKIPTTFVIDESGIVQFTKVDALHAEQMRTFVDALQ